MRETSGNAAVARTAAGGAAHPKVTLHYAQSLDGRIATRSGAARWISGPPATRFAHELRAESDAVVIGSGTALTDDPLLTVRHVEGRHPLRIVLDARGRVGTSAKLLRDDAATTIHVTRTPSSAELPAHVERWELPQAAEGSGVDLAALLARLGRRGVRTALVEGGRDVLTSFLRADLVDRIILTIAPIILGSGIDAVGDLGVERMDQAYRFATVRSWRLGEDVMIELTRLPRPGAGERP